MIIGVGGKKNAGKDTVGDYLVEEYGFQKLSFAEKGKIVICETFGITREHLETWKNEPDTIIEIQRPSVVPDGSGVGVVQRRMTFRQLIQQLLNEGMKSAYGELFHVDQLLPIDFKHVGFKYVICDMRFPFEAMRIKELGGYTVKVLRPSKAPEDPHASEQELLPELIDYHLHNTSDIPVLHEMVDHLLDTWVEQVESNDRA